MHSIKPYITLLRPKHYLKNGLVFIPLIFSGRLFILNEFIITCVGVLAFCLISSVIYIINDINDVESDRSHYKKKLRPIASGQVPVKNAKFLGWILVLMVALLMYVIHSLTAFFLLFIYFILNYFYSKGLKKIPLVDVAILTSGFIIRTIFGGVIIHQTVSEWLYLTIMAFSFYLGLGKRRNELNAMGDNSSSVRGVLKHYNKNFLDKTMYLCLCLTIVFYSLWTIDAATQERWGGNLIWTTPILLLITMKYCLNIEIGIDADPVDVLTNDKVLIILVIFYIVVMGLLTYGKILYSRLIM